jgi:hypothetical protein
VDTSSTLLRSTIHAEFKLEAARLAALGGRRMNVVAHEAPGRLPAVQLAEFSDVSTGREVILSSRIEYTIATPNRRPSRMLLETRQILMTGVRGDCEGPGEFRTTQNFIGRSTDIHAARFVPLPHLELPALLGYLEHLVNEDGTRYTIR